VWCPLYGFHSKFPLNEAKPTAQTLEERNDNLHLLNYLEECEICWFMCSLQGNYEDYCISTGTAVCCLKSFLTCFMVHSTSDVQCSVDNTIVILQTRFNAAIPRHHCIVGLVFYGLKCGIKYRKMNWNCKTDTVQQQTSQLFFGY